MKLADPETIPYRLCALPIEDKRQLGWHADCKPEGMKGRVAIMNKNYFMGFLACFGAGVALGVLCAPKSGQEFRRLLASKTKERADFVKRQATALVDSAAEITNKSRAELARHQAGLRSAVESGRKAYVRAVA